MANSSEEPSRVSQTDRYPLLMEHPENCESDEHIVEIATGRAASSSGPSTHESLPGLDPAHWEVGPSVSTPEPAIQSFNSLSIRRGDGLGRRHWSPLSSGLWIVIELVFTLSQILTAIVVISLSIDERQETLLFAWILGYVSGCVATLPILYWRYIHRNRGIEQDSSQSHQASPQTNTSSEPSSYITISFTQSPEDENLPNASSTTRNDRASRFNVLVDRFKMALDCFFAVWFVVGNVWIFGGNSSSTAAPNLYRLCLVFLTISCIGYAMPFILCAMICCCFPCIISILGIREDLNQLRGATQESINALPTYKFKLKKNGNEGVSMVDFEGVNKGGIVATGTERERSISGEDAVCCICLANYADNEELRELPCAHFFHTQCVDKWLKINALCPLCKSEVGER